MKIGNRLTIQFVLIVGFILISVLISVYSLSYFNAEYFFYERLKERVFIVSNIFFEKDELSKERIHAFEEKFQRTLPFEEIDIYDKSRHIVFSTNKRFRPTDENFFNSVHLRGQIQFGEGERQYIGLYYKDNQGDFYIIASAIDITGKKKLTFLLIISLSIYILSLLIIYFFGKYFSRRALTPIIDVVKQVKHIKLSNLDVRVSGGRNNDEIQELANTFNDMLERLQHSFELEKTFINNASHELKTPLTSIIGELQVSLSKERDLTELATTIKTILNQSIQMKELVNSLLLLTQIEDYKTSQVNFGDEEVRIDELLLELKETINARYAKKIVQYYVEDLPLDSSNLIIKGNKLLLYSAISNIIENGIKFSNEKQVSCTLSYHSGIKIDIIDKGVGIDKKDLEFIFHPFYRANNAISFNGHGIGLSISNGIIKKYGGEISVSSSCASGTAFSIKFH